MARPALSTTYSFLVSGLITTLYVGGLYIARSSRLSFSKSSPDVGVNGERARQAHERWRDDDDVIKARLKAAALSTFASCGIVYVCLATGSYGEVQWLAAVNPALQLLGMHWSNCRMKSLLPHLLTPLLYAGPLAAQFLSSTLPLQRHWSYRNVLRPMFVTWIGLRNFVVAPITEEIVFRACLLAIADLTGRGHHYKIFVTPLWFGIAHLHHAYELYHRFGRTRAALVRAIMTCLVQLTYTTLFGAYTSFLLLRTGSIIPSITAHITANIMGLPQPSWEIRQHPKSKLFISFAYLFGIVGFVSALGPWTA